MTMLPDTLCFLDGEVLPLSQARVSVLDRGFLFGDGLYESIAVYGRRPFRAAQHLARLERGLDKVRMANPLPRARWLEQAQCLIDALHGDAGVEDQMLYLQVTRGVAPRDLAMPSGVPPTVFMMVSPLRQPTTEERRHGVACVSARDFRWERGDLKSTSLLGNVLARQIAADHDARETVLFREGPVGGPWLTEGSSSNVWIAHEDALLGPPMSELMLHDVRVDLLAELCEEEGIACNLRPISEADVRSADEVMLSSASKEVLPVTRLDGEPVGHGALRGKPGPVYARLHEAYQRAKRAPGT